MLPIQIDITATEVAIYCYWFSPSHVKTHGLCRKDKNLSSNDGEGNVLFASVSHNYLCKQGESWTKLIESGLWINKLSL